MSDILDRILKVKATEIAAAKTRIDLAAIRRQAGEATPTRDFEAALRAKISGPRRRHRRDQKSQPLKRRDPR